MRALLLVLGMAMLAGPVRPGALPRSAGGPSSPVAVLDAGAAAGVGTSRLELISLQRIFQTLGIPVDVITDAAQAADYKVVFTAGELPNPRVTPALSNGLFDYVESGGLLVSAGECGNLLYPLFGLSGQASSRRRYRLSFNAGADPATSLLDQPLEKTISLGNGEQHFFDDVIWSRGAALGAEAAALGTFEDGTAGLTVHPYGRGRAYLLGVTYADSVLLPQIGGSFNAERQYVNGVEPSADVIMLLVKGICRSVVSPLVSLSTIPYARPIGLVLSHDVDAQSSFRDSLKFADLEAKYGVTSTFFITTKYFTDSTDIGYFTVPENLAAVAELQRRGWEIGSHTVSHLTTLASAPEGDPAVTRATYDPPAHLTVWGETKVSKELLDSSLLGQQTIAYRSGDLAFPRSLIRVLEGCGYLYDSTFSANAVLTAFPYFAFEDQELSSRPSSIVEIPVTFDDSQGTLTSSNAAAVAGSWLEVIRATARYGGLSVLLMHPSDTRTKSYKLQAQEILMKGVSDGGGWMGNLSALGRFWRNRASRGFSTETAPDGTLVIHLDAREQDIDPGIGFEIAGAVPRVMVMDSQGKTLSMVTASRDGNLYVGRRYPAR